MTVEIATLIIIIQVDIATEIIVEVAVEIIIISRQERKIKVKLLSRIIIVIYDGNRIESANLKFIEASCDEEDSDPDGGGRIDDVHDNEVIFMMKLLRCIILVV